MKAVLISIQPKWCNLIAQGKKTVEVRKMKPNLKTPFKVYIYESLIPKTIEKQQGKQKVIGEFICDDCFFITNPADIEIQKKTCFTENEIIIYARERAIYGWHISDLKIYDKPKNLVDFYRMADKQCKYGDKYYYNNYGSCAYCLKKITRPPNPLYYVEELK